MWIEMFNDPGDVNDWDHEDLGTFLLGVSEQFEDEYGRYLYGLGTAAETCNDGDKEYQEFIEKRAREEVSRILDNCFLEKYEEREIIQESYELVWGQK